MASDNGPDQDQTGEPTGQSGFVLTSVDPDGISTEYALSIGPVVIGRTASCDVVLPDHQVSREHARLHVSDDGVTLVDMGSQNGTLVNGKRVASVDLAVGDEIFVDPYMLRLGLISQVQNVMEAQKTVQIQSGLQVIVTGGGPVGLTFALLLDQLMGDKVAIKVYDGRWVEEDSRVVWKGGGYGNARRQQVVTLQSRQYLEYPQDIQDRLFQEGAYSEMWPVGPDSVDGHSPRNIRLSRVEDVLLEIANERPEHIHLIPSRFDAEEREGEIEGQHVLVVSEGAASRTRDFYLDKFGQPDTSMYSLDGEHLYDVILGLRVQSELSDPMSVLLTVSQNRFLLNSLKGEGFLNMRLTDEEIEEVKGVDLKENEFKSCIQSQPCLMEGAAGDFTCSTHGSLFLPALLRDSPLWARVLEGLKLFAVSRENLTAVTAFRLEMVQRPRFTAQLYPLTQWTPGTFGCLVGDAANSIHFWPGRGLNSGIPSAVSLARCLDHAWRDQAFRHADFFRHEGLMSMLQFRHKTRGWEAMITTDVRSGQVSATKHLIAEGIAEGESGDLDPEADRQALMARLIEIRGRLGARLDGLPDDQTLSDHIAQLSGPTLHTLVASGPWSTVRGGGAEVDVGLMYQDL
jgi:pSer/pThr/pTyr-binding forkhead associated (FHA) protein